MNVHDAIFNRRSVREFRNEAVDASILEELVDAAMQAPSSMNLQPWTFAVARDRATVAAIGSRAKSYLLETIADHSTLSAHRHELETPSYDLFYGAPALIVVCAKSLDPEVVIGCAMAAQNIMLSAYASGIGTCFVGLARPWLERPEGKEALGVGKDTHPIAPIVVGHPAGWPLSPGRFGARLQWVETA